MSLSNSKNAELQSESRMTHELITIAGPSSEPITIAEAKAQLNIAASDSDHDVELSSIISACREEWERDTGIATITQTVEQRCHEWQDVFRLTLRPVQSIASIKYLDADASEQTVDSGSYYIADESVWMVSGFSRPIIADRQNAIRIQYVAGYGSSSTDCSELDRQAIKLSVANRFEDRDMMGNDSTRYRRAYEALVAKKMRSSYP